MTGIGILGSKVSWYSRSVSSFLSQRPMTILSLYFSPWMKNSSSSPRYRSYHPISFLGSQQYRR